MHTSALLLVMALMSATACNNRSRTNQSDTLTEEDTGVTRDMAQDVNKEVLADDSLSDDSKNVTKAAEDGLYEVRLTSEGKAKTASASIKKMAENMQKTHEKLNMELAGLASKKGITIPTALEDGKVKDIAKLMEKTGNDFDKAFVDELVDKHEKAINLFERTSENAKDPEIKVWFTKVLPELREHLSMAKMEKDKLK